jgi:uncharacterized protein YbjT (DUF2867 family)
MSELHKHNIAVTAADSWRGGSITYWILRHIKAEFSQVRALVRNEDHAEDLKRAGAVLKKINYENPETIEHALKGVQYVILVAEDDENLVKEAEEMIRAAKKSNVQRILFISSAMVEDSENPRLRKYKEIEEKVRKYDKYFILRISLPDQVFLLWSYFIQKEGKFPLSVEAKSKWAPIDLHDVGRVIQHLLSNGKQFEESGKKTIVITGPELLKAEEIVAKFDKALGFKVKFEAISREEMKKYLEKLKHELPDTPDVDEYYPRSYHIDDGLISLILDCFDTIREGKGEQLTDEVKKITGKDGLCVEKWFQNNATYFHGGKK